jgi:transposase-like protein
MRTLRIVEANPRPLRTPFAYLVPPLSAEEFASLGAQLRGDGQTDPVIIDEDANILDGHNRYKILGDAVTTKVMSGLSPAEKKAFVFRRTVRRNLSEDQRRAMRETMKTVAFEMRSEDPKKNTQQRIADKFGVTKGTVSRWFDGELRVQHVVEEAASPVNGSQVAPAPKPDARTKYPPEVCAQAVDRVRSGEKQVAVAADLGMPPTSLSAILKKHDQEKPNKELKPTDPRRVARDDRDAEVAKLYSYMPANLIAERLGVHESSVRDSIKRLGLQRGLGSRKRNPLAPLEKGLVLVRGQLSMWTEDDADEGRRGASPEQYDAAIVVLKEVLSGANRLLRQLNRERSVHGQEED